MTITRITEFTAAENKATELLSFLNSLIAYITASDGCLACEVLTNTADESHIVVVEKWDSESSHKASVAKYPPEKMHAAMSLIAEPPKGSYYQ